MNILDILVLISLIVLIISIIWLAVSPETSYLCIHNAHTFQGQLICPDYSLETLK